MKLAVSNLAWNPEEEIEVAEALSGLGVKFIEIAPTKQWTDLANVSEAQINDYRRFWEDRGFEIVALQSLLFGRPDLTIFSDTATRSLTLDYLEITFRLAAKLGAEILVFGSPKNRLRGDLSPAAALESASTFFAEAGRRAADHGVVLCMEPNAPQYGCDFITTAAEGAELVGLVDSPGFALHLDAGCMTMAEDKPENVSAFPPRHFHISAPYLGPVETGAADYAAFATALRAIPYRGFVSIEMKPEATGNLARTIQAVRLSQTSFA